MKYPLKLSVVLVALLALVMDLPASAQMRSDQPVSVPLTSPTVESGGSPGAELLGGVVGLAASAALVAAGAGLVYLACRREIESTSESDCPMIGGVIVASLVVPAAPGLVGLGVWMGGRASGGRGSYGATFLGLAGLVPGLVLLAVAKEPALVGTGVALLPIGYLTMAVVGYDLSDQVPRAQPMVVPTADRKGAALILTGNF